MKIYTTGIMTNGKICVIVGFRKKVDHRSGKEIVMMKAVRFMSYLNSEHLGALDKDQGLVLSYSFKISGNRNCVEILE